MAQAIIKMMTQWWTKNKFEICLTTLGGFTIIGFFLVLVVYTQDMSKSSDDSDFQGEFTYAQEVYIKSGFYQNFTCVIWREYKDSIFCRLTSARHIVQEEDGAKTISYDSIRDEFVKNINIKKSDVYPKLF